MKSDGTRWYVSLLTALAAVAIIWGISEQTRTAKPAISVALER